MSAVAHSYRYLHPSAVFEGAAPKLTLATADAAGERHPYFFEGRVHDPALVAQLLATVHIVVGSRFFTPANTVQMLIDLADPVVTSGGGLLRFEGFSACCSTYVRADLLPTSYSGDVVGKGTTNVDFNAPMRAALARIRRDTDLALAVGRDEVTLRTGDTEVTERKVELPTRWIRGMLEVQSYQAGMRKRLECSSVEALQFFRSLPKASTSRTPLWIARSASGLFTTAQAVEDGVRVTDTSRLRVLQPLLPPARSLSVFADDAGQSSAWVLDFGTARLTLTLSAEVWRGFSGEGQGLWALMRADLARLPSALSKVRAQLQWQAALDAQALANEIGMERAAVDDTLRALGASGLAGFDVFEGSYFHRVLPFDLSMMDDLHPRLADARTLAQSGAVTVIGTSPFEASVKSRDVIHRVREVEGALHCTCPWFAKHQGERGPCKHALAAGSLRP